MTELILDCCLIVELVCLKTSILWGLIRLVDRDFGEIRVRRAFGFAVLLSSTYILLNRSPHYVDVLIALGVVILLGWLLFSRYCRINYRKAFLAATLFALLSTQLSDSTRMGLEMLLPDRLTVTKYLTKNLDEFTWNMIGKDSEDLQANETLGGAIHAAIEHTVAVHVVGMLSGQTRAGADDYEKVISANQDEREVFHNEHPSPENGAHPPEKKTSGSRDEQPGSMVTALAGGLNPLADTISGSAESGSPDVDGDSAGAAVETARAAPEIVVASSTDVFAEQAARTPSPFPESNPVERVPIDTAGGESAFHPSVEVMETEEILDTAEVMNSTEDVFMELSTGDVGIALSGLTRKERYQWREARKKVVVEAALTLNGQSVAIVNGKLVMPGEVVTVSGEETNYVFQLYAVSSFDSYWLPVDANERSEVQKLLRMSW